MEAKFTAGPWFYSADDKLNPDRAFGINRKYSRKECRDRGFDYGFTETIAEVCGGCDHAEGDARLMTAAPDLLAACKLATAHICETLDDGEYSKALAVLRAAIAKATGATTASA